ncbi:MAG TPA: WcaF family extracellular polysaccharide biosynthesis acetyltransferase [Verrucomicrobiae bacterium]|nr:WcaF family extracellular polysaccharide biosynthesis acetyltransferase [Verrucomicrobiae bacterium]
MSAVRLAAFHNEWYRPGRSRAVCVAWFLLGLPLLRASWLPSSAWRAALLRLFGARIGRGAVLKPGMRVKYPWLFEAGNDCWIGEDAWIDNLAMVRLGNDVCISQGAYLCTGNHDWSDPAFGLTVRSIEIADGAWVGAKSVLAPGASVGECAVVAAGSVVARPVPAFEIHAGNPAVFLRKRNIRERFESSERIQVTHS